MKRISIDISECQTADDLYKALLSELGAPDWHGLNLDALWDSITSDINDVMPPYSVELTGKDRIPAELDSLLVRIQSLFEKAQKDENTEVYLRVVDGPRGPLHKTPDPVF